MKIVKKILSKLHIYLICIASSSIAIYLLTNYINTPSNGEVIDIFVSEIDVGLNKFKDELETNKPSHLRKIRIHSAIYTLQTFDFFYTSLGEKNVDLVILPESKCDLDIVKYYYLGLDTSYILENIPDASFYKDNEDDINYGIKIREKGDTKNNIISWANEEYDEDYYAFFAKKSLHAGKLNNSKYQTSIDFVKIIKNYG